MFPRALSRHALKTRASLLTLLVFAASLWSLTLYTSQMLRQDLYAMLAEHQDNTVGLLARQLNEELGERIAALNEFAAGVPPEVLLQPAQLQRTLHASVLLRNHFGGGIFAVDATGSTIADADARAPRLGISYADRDYIQQALAQGQPAIGQPVLGKLRSVPVVGMAVPLRNAQGTVVGALAGVLDVGQSRFLEQAVKPHFSKSGTYCVVDRIHRVLVLCSDQSQGRSMGALPVRGVSPQLDRLLDSAEGSAVDRNDQGQEVLLSVRAVPVAQWLVVGSLPADAVFAPVAALQRRMFWAASVLTLLACGLMWWLLRRQLSPLLDAAAYLGSLSFDRSLPRPMPVVRRDEVGHLVDAFNRMLAQLEKRDRALHDSDERFRLAFENANIGMCLVDLQGRLLRVNRLICEISGYSKAELENMGVNDIAHPDYTEVSPTFIRNAQSGGEDHTSFEKVYVHKDGHLIHGLVSSSTLRDTSGQPLGFITHVMDITERKRNEEKLQLAASVFASAREGIMITDRYGNIMDVNDTFTQITGYPRAEVLGRNPRLLASGRQDASFYQSMWTAVQRQGHWSGEIWNRRKNGELYAELLTISTITGDQGEVKQYLGLFSDITLRKNQEEQVLQLAFYDPLTHLPNRRLLGDRLGQALESSARSGQFGAVMFMDLDNFKSLNDSHGHKAGDLLLVEVSERLKSAVRASDTVARMGGDEFVVLLGDLGGERTAAQAQALAVAEKIRISLAEPYRLHTNIAEGLADVVEHRCTASLGLALFRGHAASLDNLLKWADAAMYRAKAGGRNQVVLHAEQS